MGSLVGGDVFSINTGVPSDPITTRIFDTIDGTVNTTATLNTTNIIPSVADTWNIGTSSLSYRNLYLSENAELKGKLSGLIVGNNTPEPSQSAPTYIKLKSSRNGVDANYTMVVDEWKDGIFGIVAGNETSNFGNDELIIGYTPTNTTVVSTGKTFYSPVNLMAGSGLEIGNGVEPDKTNGKASKSIIWTDNEGTLYLKDTSTGTPYLNYPIAGSKFVGSFNANTTNILYEDDSIIIRWEGTNKQPTFEAKLTGYWDASYEVIKNDDAVYANQDIFTNLTTQYYLTGGTTPDNGYIALNYSTQFNCCIHREDGTRPSYIFTITTGDIDGAGIYNIKVIGALPNTTFSNSSRIPSPAPPIRVSNKTRIEQLEASVNIFNHWEIYRYNPYANQGYHKLWEDDYIELFFYYSGAGSSDFKQPVYRIKQMPTNYSKWCHNFTYRKGGGVKSGSGTGVYTNIYFPFYALSYSYSLNTTYNFDDSGVMEATIFPEQESGSNFYEFKFMYGSRNSLVVKIKKTGNDQGSFGVVDELVRTDTVNIPDYQRIAQLEDKLSILTSNE